MMAPQVPSCGVSWRPYLIWFTHHNMYYNMRFHELESLCGMCGISVEQLYGAGTVRPDSLVEEPYSIVNLPDIECSQIGREILDFLMGRTVLIKFVVDVWGHGDSYADMQVNLDENVTQETMVRHLNKDKSFCFRAFAFGCTLSAEYKQNIIKGMCDFVLGSPKCLLSKESDAVSVDHGNEEVVKDAPSQKRRRISVEIRCVDIQNPDTMLMILEDYGVEDSHKVDKRLRKVFVGRHLGSGRTHSTFVKPSVAQKMANTKERNHYGDRDCIQVPHGSSSANGKVLAYYERYALNKRCILGPTTMENELAFLMANHAQVDSNKLAMDCFCGTGGLLVTMGHFGALTIGNDIDMRVLKGWKIAYKKNGKLCAEIAKNIRRCEPDNKDIYMNFYQYGLRRPDAVISDNSRSPWRKSSSGSPWIDCTSDSISLSDPISLKYTGGILGSPLLSAHSISTY